MLDPGVLTRWVSLKVLPLVILSFARMAGDPLARDWPALMGHRPAPALSRRGHTLLYCCIPKCAFGVTGPAHVGVDRRT